MPFFYPLIYRKDVILFNQLFQLNYSPMSVRITESTLNVFSPATGEDISSIPMTDIPQLQSILQSVKDAADRYNFSSFYRRQKLVRKFQRGIVRHMDNFIKPSAVKRGKKRWKA